MKKRIVISGSLIICLILLAVFHMRRMDNRMTADDIKSFVLANKSLSNEEAEKLGMPENVRKFRESINSIGHDGKKIVLTTYDGTTEDFKAYCRFFNLPLNRVVHRSGVLIEPSTY